MVRLYLVPGLAVDLIFLWLPLLVFVSARIYRWGRQISSSLLELQSRFGGRPLELIPFFFFFTTFFVKVGESPRGIVRRAAALFFFFFFRGFFLIFFFRGFFTFFFFLQYLKFEERKPHKRVGGAPPPLSRPWPAS